MRIESLKMYLGALITSGEFKLSDGPMVISEKIYECVRDDLAEALKSLGKMVAGQIAHKIADKIEKDGVGGLVDAVASFLDKKSSSRKTVAHRPLDALARRR